MQYMHRLLMLKGMPASSIQLVAEKQQVDIDHLQQSNQSINIEELDPIHLQFLREHANYKRSVHVQRQRSQTKPAKTMLSTWIIIITVSMQSEVRRNNAQDQINKIRAASACIQDQRWHKRSRQVPKRTFLGYALRATTQHLLRQKLYFRQVSNSRVTMQCISSAASHGLSIRLYFCQSCVTYNRTTPDEHFRAPRIISYLQGLSGHEKAAKEAAEQENLISTIDEIS